MKKICAFLFLLFLFVTASAQCPYKDSTTLGRFYVDTLSKETWDEFQTNPVFIGHDSYIGNQKQFFDSLDVITFDQALKIACDQKNFVVTVAILQVNDNKSKTVWRLEGESQYNFNGRGPGNATVTQNILILDANTGEIISLKKIKYRAMVDF